LERWENRHVDAIAEWLMTGAADVLRHRMEALLAAAGEAQLGAAQNGQKVAQM
jgi:hypothetical protein